MNRPLLKSGIRIAALCGFAIAVLLPLRATPAHASRQVATLTEFSGTVIVQSRGDWGVKIEKGLPLYSADKVVTRTGTAVVTFGDGAVLEIRPNSNLLIEEQETSGSLSRSLRLLLGKVAFKTGIGTNKAQTNLQTPTAVVGLRGTAGILSIGIDGKNYIQFTEGGASITLGDFITGVAKDVPPELADLNPAQKAAFVAAAAADQAKTAAEAVKEGKAPEAQAALASAKAAEAAAVEAKTAAQAMINNPSSEIKQQAQATIQAAEKAIEAAKEAQKEAIKQGAQETPPSTYTPTSGDTDKGSDDGPATSAAPVTTAPVVTIPPTVTTTSTPPSTTTPENTIPPAPTTTTVSISTPPVPDILGDGSTITMSGYVNAETNEGPLYVDGTYTAALGGGAVTGSMSDGGAFDGFLGGVVGSWSGSFQSLFVTPSGDAGFLYSSMTGTAANGQLDAHGDLTRRFKDSSGNSYGKIPSGESLSSLLAEGNPGALDYLPVPYIHSVSIDVYGRASGLNDAADSYSGYETDRKGIRLDNGTILGVWRYDLSTENLDVMGYNNPNQKSSWSGTFGQSGWEGYQYTIGQIQGTDDLQGHVSITSAEGLDYLDEDYRGKIYFDYHGYREGFSDPYSTNISANASGRVVLNPLEFSGEVSGALQRLGDGGLGGVGNVQGLLGGTRNTLFTAGPGTDGTPTETLLMGTYYQATDAPLLFYGSGGYIFDGRSADGRNAFDGYVVGTWLDGSIDAKAQVLYIQTETVGGVDQYRAGYLFGDLPGDYWETDPYYNEGFWRASGSLQAVYKGLTDVDPSSLAESVVQDYFEGGTEISSYAGSGSFYDGSGNPLPGASLTVYVAEGDPRRIRGQNWGIWNAGFGGEFNGEASNDWKVDLGGYYYDDEGYDGYWLGRITGEKWEGRDIGATYHSEALTEFSLMTFDGDVLGSSWGEGGYGGYWHAAAIGTYAVTPLAWSGYLDDLTLHYNAGGSMGEAGWGSGLFGLTSGGSADYDLHVIGAYEENGYGGLAGVWSTPISGGHIVEGERDGELEGFMAGSWEKGSSSEPTGSIKGYAAAVYLTDEGKAGLLAGEGLAGDFFEIYGESSGGMFTVSGPLTRTKEVSAPAFLEYQGSYGYVYSGLLEAKLAGSFGAGSESSIFGRHSDGGTKFITYYNAQEESDQSLPWGIYHLQLGDSNSYHSKPEVAAPAWSAKVGGPGRFGYNESDEGYWLAGLNATFRQGGSIDGAITDGRYLTRTHTGTIGGPFYGLYTDGTEGTGTWVGVSTGIYEGEPLYLGSELEGTASRLTNVTVYEKWYGQGGYGGGGHYEYAVADGKVLHGEWEDHESEEGALYYQGGYTPGLGYSAGYTDDPDFRIISRSIWNSSLGPAAFDTYLAGFMDANWNLLRSEQYGSNVLAQSGTMQGNLGITAEPWTQPAALELMGRYSPSDGYYDNPAVFGIQTRQYDDTNAAYSALLGGIIDSGVAGRMVAIYARPGEQVQVGILKGSYSGTLYPDLDGMWGASGLVSVVKAENTDISYYDFDTSLNQGLMFGRVMGEFGTEGSSIYSDIGWGDTLSLSGHDDWGVFQIAFGYDNSSAGQSSSTWKARTGGFGEFGTHATDPNDPTLTKRDMGYWISDPITGSLSNNRLQADGFTGRFLTLTKYGEITGDVLGTYSEGNWQAVASGYWDGGQRLSFNGVLLDGSVRGLEFQKDMFGLLGGLDNVFTADSARIVLMGDYGSQDPLMIFSAGIRSYSPYDGSDIWVQDDQSNHGAYRGFMAGRTAPGEEGFLLDGVVRAMYHDNLGRAGILKGSYSGASYPDLEVWEAEGALVREEKTSVPLHFAVNTGTLGASLSGHFGAEQGAITGQSSGGKTEYYTFDGGADAKPWGVYSLTLAQEGGYGGLEFTGKPAGNPSWYSDVDGTGDFGLGEPYTLPWDAVVSGTWTDGGIVTGTLGHEGLDGFFYDNDRESILGIISGDFFGVSQTGTAGSGLAQSVGSWEWVVGFGGFPGVECLYSFDGATIVRLGEDRANIGIAARENGYHLLAMGDYIISGPGTGPYLQHTRLSGSIEDGGGSGLFEGFIGSVWKGGVIDGRFTAVRTESDGSAGILLGDAAGGYFSELGKWKSKGDLFYLPLVAGLDPANVTFEEKELAWVGIGSLVGGGAIQVSSSKGSVLSIAGQDWSVWQSMQAGTYTGAPNDSWAMSLTHQSTGGNHWVEVEGSKWSAERLTAKAAGAWVNWDKAMTGVMGGQLKGTFNPVDATWQSVTAGAQLETGQFMDMIARGQVDALQKLNIPCIEVGKTTLAGSSNLLNVKMKDVTFFGYSTGANPKIWATNGITGSYSGAPSPGHNVSLQSVSGGNLNANFTVKNWGNSNWGANVAGSGALNRTDVGGTVNVNFQGAAAGSYADGALKGTGAGTASGK